MSLCCFDKRNHLRKNIAQTHALCCLRHRNATAQKEIHLFFKLSPHSPTPKGAVECAIAFDVIEQSGGGPAMHRFRCGGGGSGGDITFDLPSLARNATFHATTRSPFVSMASSLSTFQPSMIMRHEPKSISSQHHIRIFFIHFSQTISSLLDVW